jgi:CheY-like chemotaxis protein
MRVATFASAVEALDAVARDRFDFILSDIGMADEDGYTLMQRIRTLSDRQKANVPAIALTAFAASEDRSRALLAGFNEHMTKPVEPAGLLTAIADLVRHRPSQAG